MSYITDRYELRCHQFYFGHTYFSIIEKSSGKSVGTIELDLKSLYCFSSHRENFTEKAIKELYVAFKLK